MKVRFTRPAREDLDEIHAYISRDSPLAASRVVDRLIRRALALAKNPYTGRHADYPGIRAVSIPRLRYVMFYAVAADEVQILHIRHTSRKPWRGP